MDITISFGTLTYVLVIVPGFLFVWTYRHFTESVKPLGEFEYAAWSFIWGVLLLVSALISMVLTKSDFPAIQIKDITSLYASAAGAAIGLAIAGSLPLAYIFAIFAKTNVFKAGDSFLKKVADNIAQRLRWG